ncbi:MAG TPA: condensation domain-containing protein [Actinoplanes sp.]|nr:condensation domain-containing protein [Actinoplanes sp.]
MSVPLTWSQQSYWYTHQVRPDRDSSKVATSWAVPQGAGAEAVAHALTELARRHASLRTTFPLDSTGVPSQVVHPPRPPELPSYEAADAREVRRLTAELARPPMNPQTDLPVRAALVTRDGRPERLIVVFNHIAVDGLSMEILWQDFSALLTGSPINRPTGRSMVEQAQVEASSAQEARRALKHWDEFLRAVPCTPFANFRALASAGTATYRKAHLVVDGLHEAVCRLARRRRVVPSIVYLSVFSVVVARLTGNPFVGLFASFGARPPELENTVGCLFQRSPFCVELPPSLRMVEALHRTRDAYLTAWEHSHHPYANAREQQVRAGAERGGEIRLGITYTYYDSELIGEVWYDTSTPQPRLVWVDPGKRDDEADLRFNVRVNRGEATLIGLAHRSVLGAGDLAALLTATARLLSEWATDQDVDLLDLTTLASSYGLPAPVTEPSWTYLDRGWIDLSGLRAALEAVPGVDAADVFDVAATAGRHELVAGVTSAQSLREADLRAHIRAAARRRGGLREPDLFLLRHQVPAVRTLERWQDAPPARAGTAPSPSEKVTVLRAAVGKCHGGADPDPALSYVHGGGRAALAAAVLAELRRQNWAGLTVDDLLSTVPLGHLGTSLRPAS